MTAKGIAPAIRDLLKNSNADLTIDEIVSGLSGGYSKGQVKASCFEMHKRLFLVKVGDGHIQRFHLVTRKREPKKAHRPYTVIETLSDMADTKAGRSAETIKEWMARTGKRIERLPNGASATPLRRIAA